MKLRTYVLGGLVAAGLLSASPASHALPTHHDRFENMLDLRMREKSLMSPVTLPNLCTADALDLGHKLRPFTNGSLARSINAGELSLTSSPYNVDVVPTQEQARALVQLGLLSHMGHFALINASNPTIKAGAVEMVNQLADVADHYKLGWLRSQYQRLASDVADAGFKGGPGSLVTRYDATATSLCDAVSASYGIDGHWHFMLGASMSDLFATAVGGDAYHSAYIMAYIDDLFHNKPTLRAKGAEKTSLCHSYYRESQSTHYLAAEAFAFIHNFTMNTSVSINPRCDHKPLPEWYRGSSWPVPAH
jgi:hypothetical protein